jgi:hypothetical protein
MALTRCASSALVEFSGHVGVFAISPTFVPATLRFYEGRFLYASDPKANDVLRVTHGAVKSKWAENWV